MTLPIYFGLVHCSGILANQKDIGTELFADMKDYMNEPIAKGHPIRIIVPASNVDLFGRTSSFFNVFY